MAKELTDDQKERIAQTLGRIRAGLARAKLRPFSEPAHVFEPEAQHDAND